MSFDRIKPPSQRDTERDLDPERHRDPAGRAALFSGAAGRPVTPGLLGELSQLAVHCAKCGRTSPLDAQSALRAVLPMALVAPWRDHPVFAVCPGGRHRAWLKVTRAE